MPLPLVEIGLLLPAFALVVSRLSGLMIAAPLFGGQSIPIRLKTAFVLALGLMVFPVTAPMLPHDLTLAQILVGLPGELLIGLVLGLGMNLIVLAAQMTGMIIGQQAGLSLATAFDPNTEVQTSVIGEIYFFVTMTIFLILGGHRELLRAVLDSFATVPVMSFRVGPEVVGVLMTVLTTSLVMAFRIAGPAIVALLLAKASLGFLSRTMPQLHILSVGFAVFVCLGMLIAALGVEPMLEITRDTLSEALAELRFAVGVDSP